MRYQDTFENTLMLQLTYKHVDSTLLRIPHIVVMALIAPNFATLATRHIDGLIKHSNSTSKRHVAVMTGNVTHMTENSRVTCAIALKLNMTF